MEATGTSGTPTQVRCPHCCRMTNHIQIYEYPFIIFAFAYVVWSWNLQRVFGCPPCVRRKLYRQALVSVVIANILCPIPLLVILVSIRESFRQTKPFIPHEFEYLANTPPANPLAQQREAQARRKRLLAVLIILAVMAVFLVFVLPAVSR